MLKELILEEGIVLLKINFIVETVIQTSLHTTFHCFTERKSVRDTFIKIASLVKRG